MTWTLTVDDTTIRITDTEQVTLQKLVDRMNETPGPVVDWTADDGTEIRITANSAYTLTHDG
ncbi:hypothetical protein BH11ACT3_BH11ACT3_00620 [soil metagenome]